LLGKNNTSFIVCNKINFASAQTSNIKGPCGDSIHTVVYASGLFFLPYSDIEKEVNLNSSNNLNEVYFINNFEIESKILQKIKLKQKELQKENCIYKVKLKKTDSTLVRIDTIFYYVYLNVGIEVNVQKNNTTDLFSHVNYGEKRKVLSAIRKHKLFRKSILKFIVTSS
jgi:hypothetical protein